MAKFEQAVLGLGRVNVMKPAPNIGSFLGFDSLPGIRVEVCGYLPKTVKNKGGAEVPLLAVLVTQSESGEIIGWELITE